MKQQEIEELIDNVKNEQYGWNEERISFQSSFEYDENIVEDCSVFNQNSMEAEYQFLKTHWEVNLDYCIPPCSGIQRFARNALKRVRAVFLLDFANKQNAINYCNKQYVRQMQLYMLQMQEKLKELEKKQQDLEKTLEKSNEK